MLHASEKARPFGHKGHRKQRARAPAVVRLGLQALGALAPELAVRVVDRLWFTPPRPPISDAVKAALRKGQALELTVHDRRVAGWSFGEGPVVLLMHGWGGYAGQLLPFVAPLVERGFQVVAYDAPGHGLSDESQLGRRKSSFLEFRATLLAAGERHGQLHGLLAHSGGSTAAAMALREGLAVHRAVFVAPWAVPTAYVAAFGAGVGASPDIMRRFQARAAARLGFAWDDLDATRTAEHVRTPPLLVIHDRLDGEVPWRDGAAIAEAWPEARLHSTHGLGHRRILGDPGVVSRAAAFLGIGRPTA